jgi:hypothetical protein
VNEHDHVDEGERVHAWRLRELIEAGYSIPHSEVLAADLAVDLRRATALVRAGCPPETAYRILR